MARMRIEREDRPKVKAQCLRLLTTLRLNPAKQQMISGFLDEYLRLNPREAGNYYQLERRRPIEGKAEGKAEALRESILDILEKRFGSVPDELVKALKATKDPEQLKKLNLCAAIEPSLDPLWKVLAEPVEVKASKSRRRRTTD